MYVLLSKLSNAMGDMIVERLKEQDDVPNCSASSWPIKIKTTSAAHRGLLSQSCVAVPEGVPRTARILRASSILR
jgi:hypothetical protein